MGIPVIDVKKIDGGERNAIMARIAQACESPGFFQVFMLASYLLYCTTRVSYFDYIGKTSL
jgi:hypothetical protein